MKNSLKKVLKVILILFALYVSLVLISVAFNTYEDYKVKEKELLEHIVPEKLDLMMDDFPTTTGLLDDAGIHSMDIQEKNIDSISFEYKDYFFIVKGGSKAFTIEIHTYVENSPSGDGRVSSYTVYPDHYITNEDDFSFSDDVEQEYIDILNLKIDEFYNEYIMEKYDCTYLVDC